MMGNRVFVAVSVLTAAAVASCSNDDTGARSPTGESPDSGNASGGGSASGGSASGGSANGGSSGSGGAPASSGGAASVSGGAGNTGGASTGGASTGGASTGGAACGASCTSACQQGCFDLGACTNQGVGSLELTPNVFTVGAVLSVGSAPQTGTLFYREKGRTTWSKGPDLVKLPDARLAGSAFSLSPATDYEVRAEAGAVTACGAFTTAADVPATSAVQQLWVDAGAPAGGTGTKSAPFQSLSTAVTAASSSSSTSTGGVDIIVHAGLYREAVVIEKGGSSGHYLRILGQAGAILDGAAASPSLSWSDEGSSVWSTTWSGDPRYVSRDGSRLYHYLSLADLRAGLGKNAVPITEGFFVESGRLYVRSSSSPSAHAFQIPALNTAVQVSGASFVWVEGLEIRYFGEGDYGKGIDVTESATHVVVRKNHVHDVPTAVWVRRGAGSVRIEDNELNQSSVFSWPWDAVKATDHENDAVTLAGGRGAIVARNVIHDVFNGVYAGSFDDDHDPALAYDVDVYANRLTRVGDDGFEPEGACVNARFWNNSADRIHNGVSLAPITYGPVWVIRNRFTDYQESGFKVSNDTSGRVWLYHNTCFTDAADHNGMNVSGPFENIVFRNNVIRGTSYSIESGQTVSTDDLDYDALFTTRGAPRIKWNDVRYDDLAALCSATQLECHGVGADPMLSNPVAGKFAPRAGSPLIDKAVRLYGINDAFAGTAPDIGYAEFGATEPPPLP